MLSLPKQRWPVWCVRMLRVPYSFTRFLARNGSYVGRKTGRRPDERKQRGARVSLAALSSLSPSPLPGSLVAPRYVAKEGGVSGGVGGCNGHVGAFLRASLLVRCSVLTIQSRTAERARSPLHPALPSSPLPARVSCEIACEGGEVTPRGRARVRRVDADLGELPTH